MKITKDQLKKIIQEEIATLDKETIDDTVMGILSDEGGAAGLDPIEAALEDLETDEISLPDEPIEDIIDQVDGVKRHADGDYVDTTQLEGKTLRITESQLRKIIAELGSYHEDPRDELATQIRHASKDIYGTKDHYDLRGKSIEELEDILYDLANSPEQKYMDDEARYEMEDEMGYDSELSRAEMAPRRQGMSRRPGGSKSQRRMESKMKITKNQLRRIIREIHPRAAADNAYMDRLETVDELVRALKSTNLGVDQGREDDEVYIMTGAAEGITVKVMRRGR